MQLVPAGATIEELQKKAAACEEKSKCEPEAEAAKLRGKRCPTASGSLPSVLERGTPSESPIKTLGCSSMSEIAMFHQSTIGQPSGPWTICVTYLPWGEAFLAIVTSPHVEIASLFTRY